MQKHMTGFNLFLGCLSAASPLPPGTVWAKSSPARAFQAKTQKRSVIDYFYLLPSLGIENAVGRQERRQLLEPESNPIIDMRHDYLQVHPDAAPAEEIAVFRAHGKPDLIADSSPDFKSDYNNFALYRLQNGSLRDVTRQVLPMPAGTDHLLYELPQFGTTIRVFRFNLNTQSRHHIFDLHWQRGRFVKA